MSTLYVLAGLMLGIGIQGVALAPVSGSPSAYGIFVMVGFFTFLVSAIIEYNR